MASGSEPKPLPYNSFLHVCELSLRAKLVHEPDFLSPGFATQVLCAVTQAENIVKNVFFEPSLINELLKQ
jgi:hypothetical protein